MNVTQIVETTEKVVIERGSARIELDCYLERINTENQDYDQMVREGQEINVSQRVAATELVLFMSEGYIEQQIASPKEGDEKLPSPAEVKKRAKAIEEKLKSLEADNKARQQASLDNKIARIIYLTKSWDVTQGDNDDPLPITPENIKRLSPVLIHQALDQIEEAVFGPLVIR